MTTLKLTLEMQRCVAFIQAHGLVIHRYPGGYWAEKDWGHLTEHFGTSTVQALVNRHVLFYDQWQESRQGKFPIRATLTEKGL